jgi:hypothetical protein
VTELGEGLKSLKGQFHLPANPIPVEDRSRTKGEWVERSKDKDIFGVLQGLGLEDLALLGGVAAELLFRAFDRFLGFPDCTQAPRNDAGGPLDLD